LSNTPISGFDLIVWKNGALQQETTDYTISGTTITFVGITLQADDVIAVRYAVEV